MKKLIIALFCLCLTPWTFAANSALEQVAQKVEALRLAMINADAKALTSLSSPQLSYGHSGGHVETQAEFVDKIVSGRSDFVEIALNNQSISVAGDVALVRHDLDAKTNDAGKGPGEVHLGVLLVWQKQKGEWKLLARQAFKYH